MDMESHLDIEEGISRASRRKSFKKRFLSFFGLEALIILLVVIEVAIVSILIVYPILSVILDKTTSDIFNRGMKSSIEDPMR